MLSIVLPTLLGNLMSTVTGSTYLIETYYAGTSCDGTPYLVNAKEDASCAEETCSLNNASLSSESVGMVSRECSSDYMASLRGKFGHSPYIMQVYSPESDCSTFGAASSFPASGNCEGSFNTNDSMGVHFIGALEPNGSASMRYFSGSPCLDDQYVLMESVDKETLESHACDAKRHRWYSSNDESSSSGSTLTTGIIVGVVAGCLIVAVVGGFCFVRRQRSKKLKTEMSLPLTNAKLQSDQTVYSEEVSSGQSALWNDEVIIAKRVPRDKVKIKKLLVQGACGQVYLGQYNCIPVAIKKLVPATRDNLQQVNGFLAEAKMTATMNHPHIVSFIGVAWDSLSDLCVLLEFMDGGDLRSLLDTYLATNHPVGIDRQKATIALHVCHALTYLHSLPSPVIHRDLKSRNILLNRAMEAKLSDFGISRERLDLTMTGGVGTSLWMAPEVMLGERYDDKADMFSFGVVLSELDMHTLPYAEAKWQSLDLEGHSMADATLLQKITTGEARVDFSEASLSSIAELGYACVSIDPQDRPSAAEALYKLHIFLAAKLSRPSYKAFEGN
ncbi:unnamed protein product [Phytophthora fragariaefolia]|uniref:Unnamed protein product n=1 Tax=Phytophthora fragariaefolia TaxID=1490495 RepID=A0A9W6XCU2_9STRA|nr:unnamed protein product [Phytophthora fragariaefolia]